MTRVLVTGATGFIGSHLVRRLLADGHAVHVLCRRGSRFTRLADVRHRLRTYPVRFAACADLQRVVRAIDPTHVLHLAAATMRAGASRPADELVRTTLLGTINLIDACAALDLACFVNTGDAFEYGPAARPLRETRACRPTRLDGIVKLAATRYAQAAARAARRPLVTLRLFSVYGPDDHPRRLIPQVIRRSLAGAPLRLSRPDIARDFLYIDDLLDLYMAVLRRGPSLAGRVINAGSGRPTTIAQIVETVRGLTRTRSLPRWGAFPTAAHDAEQYVADVTRAQTLLGWRPRTALRQGLAATIRSMTGDR